jgi:hypothetical protein
MSRQEERARENRRKRQETLDRLENSLLNQESWLTKERAKGVAIACVALGGIIFGILKASGAFSLPSP